MKYVVEHKNSDTKKRGRKGTHNYICAHIARAKKCVGACMQAYICVCVHTGYADLVNETSTIRKRTYVGTRKRKKEKKEEKRRRYIEMP